MRKTFVRACAALALLIAAPAYADGPGDGGPNVAAPPVRAAPMQTQPQSPAAEPAAAPEGRSGIVPINDDVSLNVPVGYRFYSAEEARAFLQRNNAPTPQGTVYGLVAPANANVRAPGTWATVVSYDDIGYVQPATASGLSDANFENAVRDARRTQERVFEGFASPPAFDAEAPFLVWAERTAAPGGATGKDFRHEQKVLGRRGVVGLTSIGAADQQPAIETAAADMRGMLTFAEGARHADFEAASDRVSNYSVPGLVTGVATAEPQALADPATTGGTGQTAFGGLSGYFPWIALGVVVLAGAGYMVMRRRDQDEDEEEAA